MNIAVARLLVWASVVALIANRAVAQSGIAWEADLRQARRRALQEKRPLLIVFLGKDTGDRDLAWGLNQQGDVIASSKRLVCIVADATRHPRMKAPDLDPGSWRWVCSRHASVECAAHQATWKEAPRAFPFVAREADGRVVTPQYVFASPDGKLISRWSGKLSAARIVSEAKLALRSAGHVDADCAVAERRFAKLAKQLRRGKSSERLLAIQQLASVPLLGARHALYKIARSKRNPRGRLRALESLPLPGSLDAMALLEEALSDRQPAVRRAAIRGIGDLRLPRSVDVLLRFAARQKRPRDLTEVPRALARTTIDDKRIDTWLDETIRTGKAVVSDAAMRSLVEMWNPPKTALEAVRSQLRSKNEQQRETAAWVLRELEKRGKGDWKSWLAASPRR